MEINYGEQIDINDIKNKDIELFLFAINHEKRVLTAYDKIVKSNNILKTIGFKYKENYHLECGYNINKKTIKSHNEISSLLDKELSEIKSDSINIVVDYSCMTKSWYYTIILYLKKKDLDLKKANIFFIYTPSKYSEPLPPKPNTEIVPLPGKYIIPTDKPKALIVCLGYEQSKAQGIIEHLDPKECYVFYSAPSLDNKFVDKIKSNNANILDRSINIVEFPLDNLVYLERELTSLYYLLKDKYNIIIAPLGPKPFTFISMLLSVKYRDIDIWRVGSGSDINEYKREPIDEDTFIVSEVVFIEDKARI